MAGLLCLNGITIAFRYLSEHCPLQTKRKPVITGLLYFKFILVFSLFNLWNSFL